MNTKSLAAAGSIGNTAVTTFTPLISFAFSTSLSLVIGIIYNLQVRIYLPWNADLVFFAVPFVLFGIGLRHVLNIDKVMKVQTLLILFAINVCSELANDRVDMVCRNFGNYLLFFSRRKLV